MGSYTNMADNELESEIKIHEKAISKAEYVYPGNNDPSAKHIDAIIAITAELRNRAQSR